MRQAAARRRERLAEAVPEMWAAQSELPEPSWGASPSARAVVVSRRTKVAPAGESEPEDRASAKPVLLASTRYGPPQLGEVFPLSSLQSRKSAAPVSHPVLRQ